MTVVWLALGAAALLYAGFLVWIAGGLRRLGGRPTGEGPRHAYSVIIAAHNEDGVIGDLLDRLANQHYPGDRFEVILAADRCSDGTVAVARAFQARLPALRILEIEDTPEGVSPKKHALDRAIAAARFDRFLFLDADVRPTPEHIATMDRYFEPDVAAVVGLMKFAPPGTVWERFLVFEKLLSWCVAGAGIGRGTPVIAYGGNWGYTRAAFAAVGGFRDIRTSLSGDDDLLLQRMGALPGKRIAMCLEPEGWIRMAPPDSFRHFFRQRRRHFSAGKRYRPGLQLGYLGYHLANLILWLGALAPPWGTLLLGGKLAMDGLVTRAAAKRFREPVATRWLVPFNLLFLVYNTVLGPLGHLGRVRWR